MTRRLVGATYLLLGLVAAHAAVSAYRWRTPRDDQLEKSGSVALGFEVGDTQTELEPFTFAVVRGARGSHVRLSRALDLATSHGASPVVVLGHEVPQDTLGRWRLARAITEHETGVVHLATPSHVGDPSDPLLDTTLATPTAFAFPAKGCVFRAGSEAEDWDESFGISDDAAALTFAFTTSGVLPPTGAADAVFAGGPADELHPTVELVAVAADGALTRTSLEIPAAPRPVDAWRAFECAFLPLARSRMALLGILAVAAAMVALGLRLVFRRRPRPVAAPRTAARRRAQSPARSTTPSVVATPHDIRVALRGG